MPSAHSSQSQTIVSSIEHWARLRGQDIALDYRARVGARPQTLSYEQLSATVRGLAARLLEIASPHERTLILLPSGLEYMVALLGSMYAGMIGVPVNLPGTARVARVIEKVRLIAADCRPSVIITSADILRDSEAAILAFGEEIGAKLVLLDAPQQECVWRGPLPLGQDIAFLQYTSGSTGDPKGVINGHAPLMRNLGFIKGLLAPQDRPVVASWLPLFHDMGLIMGVLAPLAAGGRAVMMSPGSFVVDPLNWLEVAAQERAGMLPGPAFAMDACVEKYDAVRCRDLDLSAIESFVPAAEPVLPRQVKAFYDTFAAHGLRWEAIRPAYGLAEATLLVTTSFDMSGPRFQTVDCNALEGGRAVDVPENAPSSRTYVSNGSERSGQDVSIVDPQTLEPLNEGEVGEIWVAGDHVAWGYWNRSQATAETFKARSTQSIRVESEYLRTGDLGFIREGHLYVTGRLKDMMILRGQCHYPNDLEASLAGAHPNIVGGAAAAFSIAGEDGAEKVVIVQEVRRNDTFDAAEITAVIRDVIGREHGIGLHDVVLIRKGTLKRTTSGKVRRSDMRRAYHDGSLVLVEAISQADNRQAEAEPAKDRRALFQAEVLLIVRKVLGPAAAQAIDPKASLFSLGFDSLAAMQAIAELERRLNVRLPEGLLFEKPSVEALVDWLMRREDAPKTSSLRDAPSKTPAAEPLAIVGLSCLFPGGDEDFADPQRFWKWLLKGGDAVRPLKADRFAPESEIPGYGACLQRVDGFDAAFFGIGAREAINTDPQQRLLMEATWHALEDAGIVPSKIRGTDTGVFIGIGTGDYGHIPFATGDRSHLDPYYGTGTAFAAAAGRLSFFFDWHGPSMAVDTACSASHAAVHYACQSLRLNECAMAIAGGVKLQMLPEIDLVLSRASMLAQDGKCKTFDASADGYVRGEGIGVVVIKRLSDALRDGDPIRAVIRESVLAQDGASAGLSAPNALAQRRMLERALDRAGWSDQDVDYIELHGTGTRLGDPIEYQALRDVFAGRPQHDPLYLGSVKTNIGHLEAGAGIAGLIKTVLALQSGYLPPHLHLKEVNPQIDLAQIPAVLSTSGIAWPKRGNRRRAGVTSFGFAGTIGHILLEQAPDLENAVLSASAAPAPLLAISARSREALEALRDDYIARLSSPSADATALANSAAFHREHFHEHRIAVAAEDANALCAELKKAVVSNSTAPCGGVAFLFTGQGSQYPGMCRSLYESEPVFRDAFDAADKAISVHIGRSLAEVIFNGDDDHLRNTEIAQPAIFAVEYALAKLWRSFGIEPDAMIGHSIGEFAAFVHGGALSLEDGARIVVLRGRLMQGLSEPGSMLAVRLPEQDALRYANNHGLSLAAVNSSSDVVLAGPTDAIEKAEAALNSRGVSARRLHVSHAFHSKLMTPILDAFEVLAATAPAQSSSIDIISTVEGKVLSRGPDALYWRQHAELTVRYADALQVAIARGCDTFIEIGPRPVLTMLTQREAQNLGLKGGLFLASTDPEDRLGLTMRRSLAALYRQARPFRIHSVFRGERALPTELPLYPFTHKSYWLDYRSGNTTTRSLPAPNRDGDQALPLYRVEWSKVTLPEPAQERPPLIFIGGTRNTASLLSQAARDAGFNTAHLSVDMGVGAMDDQQQAVYVWLDALECGSAPNDAALWSLVSYCKACQQAQRKSRVLVLTQGAQGEDATLHPLQAAFWGAVRSLAIECPDISLLLVDVAPGMQVTETVTEMLPRLNALFASQDMLRQDQTGWLSPRIQPAVAESGGEMQAGFASDGVHIVCGGTGAIGGYIMDWLVASGVRHLVVTGRGEPGALARAAFERHRLAGVDLRYERVDLADFTAMRAVFDRIDRSGLPLRSVFHCAGVGLFDTLETITAETFGKVVQSKIHGAWVLHELTRERTDLTTFALFSSISGIWGSRLQIHYGAANAYQDALVRMRRAQGLPALAIAWGPWGGKGGLSDLGDDLLDLLRRARINKFEPSRGIATLERLVTSCAGNWVAVDVDWSAFAPLYRAFGRSNLLEHVAPAIQIQETGVRPDWKGLSAQERAEIIERFVTERLQHVLKVDASSLGGDVDLIGLGLDSILVMDFARIVSRDLGFACPLRGVFENATPAKLSAYLRKLVDETSELPETGPETCLVADIQNRHEPFPLTDLQYAYWIGRDPEHVLGNIACHAYLETETASPLDLERLETAWNLLVKRHDALRLVVEDTGHQRILADVPPYRFATKDLSEADEDAIAYHLLETREEMSHQVLDPGTWPMFDIRISRLPDGRDRLHISIDMLINDAMSSQIIWQEWQRLYTAGSTDAAGLEPFEISFRDCVMSRAEPSEAARAQWERDRAYWLNQLADLPPAPQLPLALAPERITKPRFVRHQAGLVATQWQKLRERAQAVGVTPASLLIGVFGEVLAAWSDQARFSLNLTIFDRLASHPDVPRLVGDFTCLTLLALDCAEADPIRKRLQDVQGRMFEALEHRSYSAVDVIRELNRGRTDGGQFTAPVVFTSQLGLQDPTKGTSSNEVFGRHIYGITQTPQVWLDHQAAEQDGALVFNWDVVEGLFPSGMIEDMFLAYQTLLQKLADDPTFWELPVGDLRPEPQKVVRLQVNATERELPLRLLDELFFDTAERLPDATALITPDRSWTYAALKDWSLRLARSLNEAGLKRGERVVVAMEKGPEQAAACLAILSQGGVYVPIDPAMPSPRFARIAASSEVRIMLIQARLAGRVPEFSGKILLADELEQADRKPISPLPGRTLNDHAYVIYTSGSTGQPKGVLIDHRGACNTVLDINARFEVTQDDRVFGFSALGFDLSVYDLFGSFAAGAALVLPDAQGTHDSQHWAELVQEQEVTIWNSVPAVCDLLLGEASRKLSSLRLVLLSGDWIPLKLPEQLRKRVPQARLIAMGGATEASIWSNWFDVKAVDPAWRSIPYGYPLSNQFYRVLDSRLRDRPDWVIGDLHIGGTGLAIGYENDPEKTGAAFIHHPEGERLYRTGDMARYWPDGTIEFLGRRDTQVKIAGHRIELGEIEAALTAHPSVREAVVGVIGSDEAGRRLMGWLLLDNADEAFHDLETAAPEEADRIAASLKESAERLISPIVPRVDVSDFAAWQQDLAGACAAAFFHAAGLFDQGAASLSLTEIVEQLALHKDYHGLLSRWLGLLEQNGVSHENGRWSGAIKSTSWQALKARGLSLGISEDLVGKLEEITPRLLDVIRGETDPLEVFYDRRGLLSPEKLARQHPSALATHQAIGRTIRAMADAAGRKLNILEIGARSGTATRDWLAMLDADVASVTISDPSQLLLEEARVDGLDHPHITWQVLDPSVEPPPALEHRFDVVVAFNALHRGQDIDLLLSNCRQMLAPAGHLIAVELTSNGPMIDVTAALIERGFGALVDLRSQRRQPLLSGAEWCKRLEAAGFLSARDIDPGMNGDLKVLIARNRATIAKFQPEQVSQYLEGMVPGYMVPRQFMPLKNLPLSSNGKVDRKRLPLPSPDKKADTGPVLLATQTERALAEIWSDLLGSQDMGRDTHFFAAGGDSLIAVRMAERIRSVFGCKVALREIFSLQVLKALAAHIDTIADRSTTAETAAMAVSLPDQFKPFPMTDVQQAYFIGRQPLFPLGGVSTHLFAEIDVTEHSVEALNWAWNKLVQRHGMLRAVIESDGTQRILAEVPAFSFMTSDISDGNEQALDMWLTRQRRDMSHRVYDTGQWPLFDIRAARLPGSVRLLISLDNLICDGRSMVMLLSEWAALARDRNAVLPALELSFRDVVLHWQEQENTPAFATSLEYWLERLADLPSGPNLPLANSPETLTPPRFCRLEARLEGDQWERFKARAAQKGLSANAALLAAYAASLRQAGGGDFFSLNLTLFRREDIHPQIDLLVGDFTSLLLVPFDARTSGSFREVAQALQHRLMSDLEHAQVSAVRVMREAARRGGNAQALAVPVVFTSGVGVDNTASDGTTTDWLGRFTGGITQTPQVWIDHQVVERNGELVFNWDYVEGLFDAHWINGVFALYSEMLERLSAEDIAWEELLPPVSGRQAVAPAVGLQTGLAASTKAEGEGDPALEKLIAQLLGAEPGLGQLDPERNFFELGATSLTLIRLHQKLRQALERDFPVVALFSHASIRALAGYLSPTPSQQSDEGSPAMRQRRAARDLNAQRRRPDAR
ncbi:non-ribosomal peptide synthetase/type I polyketide synthase [Rhizobium sp. FKY42]|uniref:non-ribosomal peptide synthetase/type I polyketide synthase n=1 Tax=Rhizobium sp. FKY42 TaxID=2562310 RepID=UPI001485AF4A|nr:non-ribosomal peptide synthetase/type I polyketide synthase [Rhizobium sp. FKY42]